MPVYNILLFYYTIKNTIFLFINNDIIRKLQTQISLIPGEILLKY